MISTDFNLTVGNPYMALFFLVLLLIIILHFYFLRHSKLRALKFGNFEAMKRVEGSRIISKNLTPLFFLLIIMSLMILTLLDVNLWLMEDVSGSDYFILLDSGASMNSRDIYPDRFFVGKEIARGLVKNLSGTEIGFISFGGTIIKSSPLTTDKSRLLNLIDESEISNTGTDIGLAISSGIENMLTSNKSRTIILISDGHDTVGIPLATALKKAQEEHVKIFSVGVGTLAGGSFLKVPGGEGLISKLNEDNLLMLSNKTSSIYINVDSEERINEAVRAVQSDTKRGYVKHNLSLVFTMAAVVLLFFSWLLSNTRFRIFP